MQMGRQTYPSFYCLPASGKQFMLNYALLRPSAPGIMVSLVWEMRKGSLLALRQAAFFT